MIVVNQRIFVDEHRSSRLLPAFVMPSTRLLASIFDTLLSSQGSDAHHPVTLLRFVLGQLLQVTASMLGRQTRDPLLERPASIALGSLRCLPTVAGPGAGFQLAARLRAQLVGAGVARQP